MVSIERQSLLQSVQSSKLCITKALRLVEFFVFNNSDICNLAASEEIVDVFNSSIKREVSEMDGIRWLIGKGKLLTYGVTWARATVSKYTLKPHDWLHH